VRRELFDYDLPPELIADHPAPERDGARLLVVDAHERAHRAIRDLPELVDPGTLVVVNDTRVIPARLFGHKVESGGKVEIFLVRLLEEGEGGQRWSALGRASKPLRVGARIAIEGGPLTAEITAPQGEGGLLEVRITSTDATPIDAAIDAAGHVPLPPYVHRADEAADRERYQTIFARERGAVAAPTAGLHLTEAIVDRLKERGASLARVTLHVGLGTFQPVTAEDLDDHPMHSEVYAVPAETAAAIAETRARGGRVLAIGTTVVRALESAADPDRMGFARAATGETRLLIQPGYRFRVVDQLLTNFHLPQSTLLALVSAFAGRERILAAYRAAIDARYRFYSYGDAMLLRAREDA
jgi:S-adenosylmethionine:tRNA ribosyltransferase-isomerase